MWRTARKIEEKEQRKQTRLKELADGAEISNETKRLLVQAFEREDVERCVIFLSSCCWIFQPVDINE